MADQNKTDTDARRRGPDKAKPRTNGGAAYNDTMKSRPHRDHSANQAKPRAKTARGRGRTVH